jgi:hypothetical protein
MEIDMGTAASQVTPYSLDSLVADIKPGFSFVRYGNGEWDLILGRNWRTGSRTQYFTDSLREAMRQTLLQHNGATLGMQRPAYLTKCGLLKPARDWLRHNGLDGLCWREGDVLHDASAKGELPRFVDAIRGDVAVIGPSHLSILPFADRHIEVPSNDAWSAADVIFDAASTLRDCVVLVSAGPMAKVLVHRLHALDRGCATIDTGSVLDPYCGVLSRRYMRDISFPVLA